MAGQRACTDAEQRYHQLSEGGFAPGTELLTTEGITPISELTPRHRVYALHPQTGLAKPKAVLDVANVDWSDSECLEIVTERSNLRVAPAHRLPFRTAALDQPRIAPVRDLAQRSVFKFCVDWTRPPRPPIETVDVTDYLDEYEICAETSEHGHTFRAALPAGCEPVRHNSHTGYYFDPDTFERYQRAIEAAADRVTIHDGPNAHRRPYRFDGDDFIELLGWFATEGSVHWSQTSDTAQVRFAQQDPQNRERIVDLLDRMGFDPYSNEAYAGFSAGVYGRLFESLCGTHSQVKRLPDLVWECSREQQQLLLDTLVRGDGNARGTFYTASEQLANDVLRLGADLGIKPRYTIRDGIWQVYLRRVNDGVRPPEHVTRRAHDGSLYRLAVEDYGTVLAGRDGKFQWTGVSRIG